MWICVHDPVASTSHDIQFADIGFPTIGHLKGVIASRLKSNRFFVTVYASDGSEIKDGTRLTDCGIVDGCEFDMIAINDPGYSSISVTMRSAMADIDRGSSCERVILFVIICLMLFVFGM